MTNTNTQALEGVIDGRCFCERCEDRTQDIYRMVGSCRNCGAGPFLILYRAGDKAARKDCPACGGYWDVHPDRRATDDEIPAAVRAGGVTGQGGKGSSEADRVGRSAGDA